MAEHPGSIEKLFLNKTYADTGRYSIRLFRASTQQWETVSVDDGFPVKADGTPLYAKPNGSEVRGRTRARA